MVPLTISVFMAFPGTRRQCRLMIGHSNAGASDLDGASSGLDKSPNRLTQR